MLVVISLKRDGKNLEFISTPTSLINHTMNGIKCSVLDTSTNKIYNNFTFLELYESSTEKKILGIIDLNKICIVIPLDLLTWKIMDLIHDIEKIDFDIMSDDFTYYLSGIYENLKYENTDIIDDFMIYKYASKGGTIYAFYSHFIERLDDIGLFWKFHSKKVTLSYLYKLLNLVDNTDCVGLYIVDKTKEVTKLEINKDILRLITKSKVLGDKLCW